MSCFLYLALIVATILYASDGELYNKLCSGRGNRNSHGICECMTGYYGQVCEYKKCPYGPSWLSPPMQNDVRYSPYRQCSDMGHCDHFTGLCECRSGYEGRACERLTCPTSLQTYTAPTNSEYKTTHTLGVASTSVMKVGMSYGLQCSGHGVCKTLREMARGFNGLTIVRPPVEYDNWDADRIQGCVCDSGWEGYDCSRRSCPKGRDPALPSSKYDKEEVFVLQCQADNGYFAILALGYYTDPIPYNADPGYVKYALESLPQAGKVTVTTSVSSNNGSSTICGQDKVATTFIHFTSYFGDRPPLFLTHNTSNTRQWPQGSERLSLSTGHAPILRMVTQFTLSCPLCPHCSGHLFLVYKKSTSDPIDITALRATEHLQTALEQLDELWAENWSNVNISIVTNHPSDDRLCSRTASTTIQISIYSDYGNLPNIEVIDASYSDASHLLPANLTLTTNKGNGTLYECSNQGTCDYTSGVCTCNQQILSLGEYLYRARSSDGKGQAGGRADCGYFHPSPSSCFYQNQDVCNGHGICGNATKLCACYDGWFGVTCGTKSCPKGRAYFDEPISSTEAHQVAECSGVGLCDRQTGFCKCRTGFIGPACEIKDCYRDSTGKACSGFGTCVNMAQYFSFYNLSYGNASAEWLTLGSQTWDAFNWYECICNALVSKGFTGNPLYPLIGPSAVISGTTVESPPLPGNTGWDCSLRGCPKGDNTLYGYNTIREIQRVVCNATSLNTSFHLTLFKEQSLPIHGYYTDADIQEAIEAMPGIGKVSVAFPYESYDSIVTACNASTNAMEGGFLIRFETIEGDVPLFDIQVLYGHERDVRVEEFRQGVSTNEECSGPNQGYCDVLYGTCACNKDFASSDGTKNYGARGDCSYKLPHPTVTYNIQALDME